MMGARKRAPDIGEQREGFRLRLLQLAGDKRVEIVRSEIALGHFGEELLRVRQPVVLVHFAGGREDGFVFPAVAEFFPRAVTRASSNPIV